MNEDIKVSFSETGARTVKRNMDAITTSAEKAQTAVDAFKATLKFGTNNRSIAALTGALTLLRAELAQLNSVAGVIRTLRAELATLQTAGTFLKNLVAAMTGLNAASANLTSFTKTLQQISTHAGTLDLVTSALNKLAVALPILTTFKTELSAVVALTPQVQALAAAIRGLGAIKTDIRDLSNASKQLSKDIEAAAKHAQNAHKHINQMGGVSHNASQGVWRLRHSLAGIASLLVVSKVREWLDAWQSAAGLFKVATDSMEEMKIVQQEVVNMAKDTRQEFTPMVELYARMDRASEDLGSSQNEMIKFTKGVATTLAIQHTSATQARGALMQLGQALGLGRIRAQEFNSMNENLYLVLKTVAKNMDDTGGSVVKLRQKMLAGKLSSRAFFEAFLKGLPELEKDFKKTTVTISQALTVAETNFISYIGKLDDALGISDKFGRAVIALTNNLNILVPVITAVGVALIGAFGPKGLGMAMAAVRSFVAMLAANPMVALVAGLAAAAVYVASVANEMNMGSTAAVQYNGKLQETQVKVSDFLGVVWGDVKNFFGAFWMVASDTMREVGFVIEAGLGAIGERLGQGQLGQQLTDFFKTDETGIAAGVIRISRLFDYMGMSVRALFGIIGTLFGELPSIIEQGMKGGYNAFAGGIDSMMNAAINKASELSTKLGGPAFEQALVLKKVPVQEGYFDDLGGMLNKVIREQMTVMNDPNAWSFENLAKDWIARSKEAAQARLKAELEARDRLNAKSNPTIAPNEDAIRKARQEAERLRKEFEKLQEVYDPMAAANRSMAEDLETIAKAQNAGLISAQRHAAYAEAIAKHYEDALDPIKAMTTEHEKEIATLKMAPDIRKAEEEVTRRVLELRKQMGIQAKIDTDLIREQVRLQQEQERIASAKQQIYGQTVGARQNVVDERKAVGQMLEDPNSKFGIGDARKFWMNEQPTLFEGTQEQMDAQRVQYEQMYRDIDLMRQQDVISERTAGQMRKKVAAEEASLKYKNAQDFFGNLATLSKSGNARIAAIGKAAAITQATIDGVLGVQKALASAPPPINYALAAAVGAAAAANVAQIASQPVGFMTGGEFTVGGRGGADSQMVAFRATPGERVQVQTPEQYRKGDPNGDSQQTAQDPMSVKVINVLDPRLVGNYLSTPEGERTILNVIEKNPATVRRMTLR